MRIIITTIPVILIALNSFAQAGEYRMAGQAKSQLVSLDLHLPLGVFARSQFAGAGLNYSWSNHRYGSTISKAKLVGFTANAGGDYYFGRRIRTAGYPFQYGGYLYGWLMAGIITNPWTFTHITLTGGPTVGIYKGNADMGFGVNLFSGYFINQKIAVGPGITYKKHPDADGLWTGSIRISYLFGGK
jgi:hypothetical protein